MRNAGLGEGVKLSQEREQKRAGWRDAMKSKGHSAWGRKGCDRREAQQRLGDDWLPGAHLRLGAERGS